MGKSDPQAIKSLLAGVEERKNALFYIVIYLSPGKYHRFNSPVRHTVLTRRHIPGYLRLVRPSYVTKNKNVFLNSERVNSFGQFYG